jgi:hypothetical protein
MELAGPPSRQAPDALYEGPLAVRRKRALYGCFTAGAICVALAPLPFVKTMAIYFLPLGYLLWIGLALAVLGTVAYVLASELRKVRRYIEVGEVGLARVVDLVKAPVLIYNGVPSMYAFLARLELPNESGELGHVDVQSRQFSADAKDRVHTPIRVGELVPVVWLPGKKETTVQIYDFLEATNEHALVRERRSESASLARLLATIAAMILLFFVLFWNLYAFGRYQPLEFDFARQIWAPFGVAAGIVTFGLILGLRSHLRKNRLKNEQNAQALASGEAVEAPATWDWRTRALMLFVALPGLYLLAGLTLLLWCFTANSLLDNSPPQRVPVQITEMTQTTHNFLFRHYDMKFRRLGEEKDHSMLTTPEHLDQFVLPVGMAVVRQGRFGWPWVETIEPGFQVDN